jgi:hypothetical protein
MEAPWDDKLQVPLRGRELLVLASVGRLLVVVSVSRHIIIKRSGLANNMLARAVVTACRMIKG